MLTNFKSLSFRTKVAVGATGIAASLAAGGAAFAYITGGNGAGTGSATTSTPTMSGLTASASGTATYDGQDDAISVTITNNAKYSIQAGSIDVSISSLPTGCPTGSFVMDTSHVAGPYTVGPNGGTASAPGTNFKFVDLGTGTDQTKCTTGSIGLSVSINAAA